MQGNSKLQSVAIFSWAALDVSQVNIPQCSRDTARHCAKSLVVEVLDRDISQLFPAIQATAPMDIPSEGLNFGIFYKSFVSRLPLGFC